MTHKHTYSIPSADDQNDARCLECGQLQPTTHTAKHTPGPWVVDVEGRMVEAQLPNLRDEYEHICDLRGGIKGQINVGNAHLIAAAPAMYEALQAIIKNWERGDLAAAVRQGAAALAQAEGKQ